MKKYFEGKEILCQIAARLVPPNQAYPDAICSIIMTTDALYVSEDNYDGTFTYHFIIPLEKIVSVDKYNSEINDLENDNNTTPFPLSLVFLALTGIIFIPGKRNQKVNKVFLRVIYKVDKEKTTAVFFENCSSTKSMVNAFKKYKR